MNSFPEISQKGAQCFFNPNNEESKKLATAIQNQLLKQIDNARTQANKGDYYILNISDTTPISIIECGFLTNPDEEKLLSNEEYQSKLAYTIMCGVVDYLGIENTYTEK